MKKGSRSHDYYEEYLEVCSSVSLQSLIIDLNRIIKQEPAANDFNLPFGTCLIDYSKSNYSYLSNHSGEITGHPRDNYLEKGLDYHTKVWHPEDRIIFEEQVFRDIREFWSHIEPVEFPKYRFSFNYRYYKQNGELSHFLQHSTYLEPQAGKPLLNLTAFTDVGDFKNDNNIVLIISYLLSGIGYKKVFTKTYSPLKKSILSPRESEILRLSLEGMSSKMIAEKLFISVLTVKHHKQNMMEKTSTRNITGLINMSLNNSWI